MRIVFFNSGAAPGRDGVGDYTRLLAHEVAARGHDCRIVALNDRLATAIEESGDGVREWRLPERLSWEERRERILPMLRELKADWCSIQFVPFGFHPRGVPKDWPPRFQEVCGASRVHFMFHETWIGGPGDRSLKRRVIGWVQRGIVHRILRGLAVKSLHTSNGLYQSELRSEGIATNLLPLFGSVPLPDGSDADAHPVLASSAHWKFAMFGSLHPVWPPEPLLPMLIDACRRRSLKCSLLSIGNMGSGVGLWEAMRARYPEIEFVRIGEQSPQQIASIFSKVDCAIATTPLELLGKSASAAALLEHGLPLIVNSTLPAVRRDFDPMISDLILTLEDLPQRLPLAQRKKPQLRLGEVADRFLSDLAAAPA